MEHQFESPIIAELRLTMTTEVTRLKDKLSAKKVKRSRREMIQTTLLRLLAIYHKAVIDEYGEVIEDLVKECEATAMMFIIMVYAHEMHDKKVGRQYPQPKFNNASWDAVYAIDELITKKECEPVRRFYLSLANVY